MNPIWLMIAWLVGTFTVFIFLIRKVKIEKCDWTLIEDQEVIYEERFASGSLMTNGIKGLGGANRALRVRITTDFLVLGDRHLGPFGGNQFGFNQIIPIESINKIEHESEWIHIYYSNSIGEQKYRLKSKNSDDIIKLLQAKDDA